MLPKIKNPLLRRTVRWARRALARRIQREIRNHGIPAAVDWADERAPWLDLDIEQAHALADIIEAMTEQK